MGEPLEIAKVLVEPGMKLMELVGNAIGTVYAPVHERKMADAEAYKIKTISEAVNEASLIPLTYEKDGISINTTDINDLYRRAELREIQQKIREQKNIEAVIGYAQRELLDAPKVPNTPVDDDWMDRLLNNAKEVSSATMQFIWGRILAGEVVAPGSFSKRTLDIIRNLSQKEAATFQKIIPFVVHADGDLFITNESDIYEKYGITFEDLILLDECGLLSSAGLVSLTQTLNGAPGLLIYTAKQLLSLDGAQSYPAKFTYGIHSLTSAGKELFQILEYVPHENYFFDLSEHIFKKSKGSNLSVHQVNSISGKNINYNNNAIRTYHTSKGST